MEAGAAPDSLQLSLSTSLPAYRPGDTVTALLHATTPLPDAIELRELQLSFAGIERIDTSWVSPSYRRDVPTLNADRRRAQRHVAHAELRAATQGGFGDASARRYLIRFTLPPWLPPSFRGTAVRYSYFLDAVVKYTELHPGVAPLDLALGPPTPTTADAEAAERGRAGSATARLVLQILPPADGGSGAAEAGAAPAAGPRNDVFPVLMPDDLPLRCWEIGAGTEVRDAVTHIARAASGPLISGSPFSPGRAARRDDSRSALSESTSEISHPEEERIPAERGRTTAAGRPGAAASAAVAAAAPQAVATVEAGTGGLRSYGLRINDQPLVRVSIHPPLEGGLQPGATLAGTLDFQPADAAAAAAPGSGAPSLRCMQVSVLLETEEAVAAAWRPAGKQHGGGGLRRVHDEHVEVTADTACTSFLFTLPQDATPAFRAPLLALRWVLRFGFTAVGKGGRQEQLAWTLPLAVLLPH